MNRKSSNRKSPRNWTIELPAEEYFFEQMMLTAESAWKYPLSRNEIDKWLLNFRGDFFPKGYERRLALLLLINFCFYNEKEVRHFCKELFRNFAHWLAVSFKDTDSKGLQDQLSSCLLNTKFCPLGQASESGGLVLYLFRQENVLPVSLMTNNSGIKRSGFLAVVDDATLSADQAIRFLKRQKRDNPQLKVILLTFVASEFAISELQKKGYEVVTCVRVDERSKAFSNDSAVFRQFPKHLKNAKKMAYGYGKRINPEQPLGFNQGEYCFGFYYNTPDNCLPIFWGSTQSWQPIFRRYDKLITAASNYFYGPFV